MYEAYIENSRGNKLQLTGNQPEYQIIDIVGLNPPKAQLNTMNIAGMDGAKLNSAKLDTRELVITLKLNGDAEANRIMLYQYFPTKEQVTFYYSNRHRDVFIKGYVNTCEVNPFSQSEQMQISIICPQPYFKDMDVVIADISNVVARFVFPFSINIGEPIAFSSYFEDKVTKIVNKGASKTGVLIYVDVLDSVNDILIRNVDTGETFELAYGFRAGDRIIINTNSGEKSVRLSRNGENMNLFSSIVSGSTFLQLTTGDNYFAYKVDDGLNDDKVYIQFIFYAVYRGV